VAVDVFVAGDSTTLLFDRNDSGEVTGFRLTSGRVRNLRFRRAPGQ
jgi:hypothetical protein